MNEYDSNRIAALAEKINYIRTKDIKETDCYVLNTCHIREKATDKVYHDIGRVKKEFRNKKKPIIIIAGCVAQAEGEVLLKKESYIDAVIGPQSYHEINEIIIIPANRIGNRFMSAAQVSLWSYIFDFLGQILSNTFWLKLPTTLDDYAAMALIFIGMYISVYKKLG